MKPGRLLDGRLKIRHLVLVTAIAEAGSIVRAAEAMHVTQPVVTRGLHDIEDILGVALFDRLPRGVTPTVYGDTFIEHARAVLAQLRSADEQVQMLRTGEIGPVTVGTHLAGSNLLLPRAIAALKRHHPLVVVSVREATPDTLQQDLLAGELDMVVGRLTPSSAPTLVQERLCEEPIRLSARVGHPAHELAEPTLAALARFPWILPVARTVLRSELEQLFLEQGVPLPVDRIECTSILTLRQLLVSTDVIAALPLFIVTQDDGLRVLPTGLGSIRRSVGVTRNTTHPPAPAADTLLRHLREEGAALAALADR